jgi:tetratricopeptide (TPR) repeat protein
VKRRAAYPEAYDIYLQARSLMLKMTDETYKKAEDLFKAGIEKWPDFALPLMGLTWLNILGTTWGKARPRDAYPKAKEYALRALELDGSLGDAYAASGFVRAFYDWDWTGAERDFKKALDLNPNSPDVHQSYASFLTCVKRHEEAVIEAKKARKLDPLSGAINSHSAQTFYYAGRTDEAVEILRETIILNPSIFLAHYVLGHIHSQRSMAQESLAEFEKAFELSGGYPLIATILIGVYNGLGRTDRNGLEGQSGDRIRLPAVLFLPPLEARRTRAGRRVS